jgi:hypothetical protein
MVRAVAPCSCMRYLVIERTPEGRPYVIGEISGQPVWPDDEEGAVRRESLSALDGSVLTEAELRLLAGGKRALGRWRFRDDRDHQDDVRRRVEADQ